MPMTNNPDYQKMSIEDKIAALEAQNERLIEKLAEALEEMCRWMNIAKSLERSHEHDHN